MTKHSDNHGSDIKKADQGSGQSSITERIHDILDNSSSEALSLAKTNWYFGEWEALGNIEIEEFADHPDVALLAALKATGHQQLNEMDKARQYFRAARELGCDDDIIARLLVAGVHNSLGKIAALQDNDDKTLQHFEDSVNLGNRGKQAKLASHARSVKEIIKLGLLPQAAKLIEEQAKLVRSNVSRPRENEARFGILKSEIELINQQLILAYQKQQLYFHKQKVDTFSDKNGSLDIKKIEKLSPSQLGQDLWVIKQSKFKRNGFFVDFGATDGVLLSNTYLLEKYFGWEGVCSEPNPWYFRKLKENRDCIVSSACISDKTGSQVDFILANEFSGIDEIANEGMHKQRVELYKSEGSIIPLTTISLHDFLKKHNAPKSIDYVSIDTEGSEYRILRDFPFDVWDIKMMTIEHNFEPQRDKIRQLLIGKGYKCIEVEWEDWYYKEG